MIELSWLKGHAEKFVSNVIKTNLQWGYISRLWKNYSVILNDETDNRYLPYLVENKICKK